MRVENPVAFDVGVTYTRFLRRHRELYRGVKPYAEVALILPRRALTTGHPDAMRLFKSIGESLATHHALIDVVSIPS